MPTAGKHPIRWDWLADGRRFYEQRGYRYVEVPWLVHPNVTEVTHSDGVGGFACALSDLVGSGEQGFLQMMLNGDLPLGRYQTITPCFRDEMLDDLHHTHFMKLELIDTAIDSEDPVGDIINDADQFAAQLLQRNGPWSGSIWSRVHRNQIDMLYGPERVELGSYGVREHNGLRWVYGTGIAEPRWSCILDGKDNILLVR